MKVSKKTILFVSHLANFQKFNLPLMRYLKSYGHQVYYASSGEEDIRDCDGEFKISIARSPLSFKNLRAVFELKEIILSEKIDLIHCHTPTGGVVARIANLLTGRKAKIIYTAHGFHFYKGAPLFNWVLYYNIEKALSRITDAIITINQEDFELANKKFKTRVYKINGVGVDLTRFSPVGAKQKQQLRKKHHFSDKDFIMIYVADLRKDKNQLMITRNASVLKNIIPNLKILFVGKNTYEPAHEAIQKSDCCEFLGYRKDIDELFQLSDLAISTSVREGQGLNLIEAMASGTPVVCSRIRGHVEVINDQENGLLFGLENDQEMQNVVEAIYKNTEQREKFIEKGLSIVNKFSQESSVAKVCDIYKEVLNG